MQSGLGIYPQHSFLKPEEPLHQQHHYQQYHHHQQLPKLEKDDAFRGPIGSSRRQHRPRSPRRSASPEARREKSPYRLRSPRRYVPEKTEVKVVESSPLVPSEIDVESILCSSPFPRHWTKKEIDDARDGCNLCCFCLFLSI